jgi:hypothetical protein
LFPRRVRSVPGAALLALLAGALACGCVDLEVARFARARALHEEAAGPAGLPRGVGRSCVTVVGILPVTPLPSLGQALAAAGGEGALADVVMRYELRYVPFLGGRGCYVVEGRPEP